MGGSGRGPFYCTVSVSISRNRGKATKIMIA